MSYPTETMSDIRLHGMVNAELMKIGRTPVDRVWVDDDNGVFAEVKRKSWFRVGNIEYVPGLGEVFNFKIKER